LCFVVLAPDGHQRFLLVLIEEKKVMRKVSFTMNISIDGYCDHELGSPTEELMDYFTGRMNKVDLLFYGRKMYEMMFPYWSDVVRDRSGTPAQLRFAERLMEIDKVVVSTTMERAGHQAGLVRADPVGELRRLKGMQGGEISVDSVSMLPELVGAGLIDEFHLVVHPVLAGGGRLLLPPGSMDAVLALSLADTRRFESGCVAFHYVKAGN
jgi:dihydrofolate reductase